MSARLGLLEAELSKHEVLSSSCAGREFRSLFNVRSIPKLVAKSCRKRDYRYPFIYRPTFNIEECSPVLTLVVCLTGAVCF